ncbi:phage tail protein [Virgibacillus salexigens]|uniref:Phage tail protein n=1 Tax=Virgibacillus kapii TaxID=1638645 RepID=A0ABQ2DA63_9BACI|nr:phage tail protein [Virgibacillus kapii]GGJ50940.1 hypothetical protein GCM10007111_11540 [Virgibacillus kapii]
MAKTIIEEFDAVSIENASLQFFDKGQKQPGQKFGCLGTIEGETELKEIVKMCAGQEKGKTTKPIKMNLTLSGHVKVAVIRNLFGLTNQGLKPGVYKYSTKSKGKTFVLTADVVDEFTDVTKLIAFPNCISATGLKITVQAGADEVAELELEITAYPDKESEEGNFYYESFKEELEDTTIVEQWHKEFNHELVAASGATGGAAS